MGKLGRLPNQPSSSVSRGMCQGAEAPSPGQAPTGWQPGAGPHCMFITRQVPPWACLPLISHVVSVLPDQEMKIQQIKRPARSHRRAGCSGPVTRMQMWPLPDPGLEWSPTVTGLAVMRQWCWDAAPMPLLAQHQAPYLGSSQGTHTQLCPNQALLCSTAPLVPP